MNEFHQSLDIDREETDIKTASKLLMKTCELRAKIRFQFLLPEATVWVYNVPVIAQYVTCNFLVYCIA